MVLTTCYRITGDDLWRQTAERIVGGLREIAVDEEDYAYFPKFYFEPGERPKTTQKEYIPHLGGAGWVLNGLGKFYRETGYEPARELGERLSRFLIKRLGSGATDHWHTTTQSLIGILELALATSN